MVARNAGCETEANGLLRISTLGGWLETSGAHATWRIGGSPGATAVERSFPAPSISALCGREARAPFFRRSRVSFVNSEPYCQLTRSALICSPCLGGDNVEIASDRLTRECLCRGCRGSNSLLDLSGDGRPCAPTPIRRSSAGETPIKMCSAAPASTTSNMSLFKNMPFSERWYAQLTSATFSAAGAQANGTFGQYTAAANARNLQLALRITF